MHWIISRMTRACVSVSLVRKPKKWSNCGLVIKTFPLHSTLFFPHLKKFTLEIASRVEITPFLKVGVAHNFFQPKYTTLFLHQDLGSFFFFGLETPIFQVIFKKVLKRLPSSAALMTVQFIGSSTLDACQDGATQYYSTLKVSSIR